MTIQSELRLLMLLPAISVAGCSMLTTPPEEDPVLIKLEELDQRLQAIERVIENQSLAQMTQQVETLQRRADTLQGQTETLAHEATGTAERQRQLYADLDSRIQELEANVEVQSNAGVLDGGTVQQGELPVPGGSDRDNYQVALELLRNERYDESAASFKQFLVSFPGSELASNAQYWLAESYYASNQFQQALTDFAGVIDKYPNSSKVADALLKMGYCNYSLQRWDEARSALQRVQSDYPTTTAARLAGQYLKRMETEGV